MSLTNIEIHLGTTIFRLMNLRKKEVTKVLLYLLSLLILQEVIFRVVFPLPEVGGFNRMDYTRLGFSKKKHHAIRKIKLRLQSSLDEKESIQALNLYGFRDHDWNVKKEKKRMFVVGDSFVEGQLVADEETISRQLQQQLPDYEVMNFGVMAAGIPQYQQLIKDATPIFLPDEVVLVLYANDLPYVIEPIKALPEYAYNNYNLRILEVLKMIQHGEMLPLRWPLRTVDFYPKVPSVNNPWTKDAQRLGRSVEPKVANEMARGAFNPYATNLLKYYEEHLQKEIDLSAVLEELHTFLQTRESDLTVIYIPCRHQVTDYYLPFERQFCLDCDSTIDMTQAQYQVHAKALSANCNELNIPFLDLTAAMRGMEGAGNHLYWDYDEHLNVAGSAFVAQHIYEFGKAK